MHEEEDWLLRPVVEGMCRYESLKDGTLSLYDVMLMNEALDVRVENRFRMDKATRHG